MSDPGPCAGTLDLLSLRRRVQVVIARQSSISVHLRYITCLRCFLPHQFKRRKRQHNRRRSRTLKSTRSTPQESHPFFTSNFTSRIASRRSHQHLTSRRSRQDLTSRTTSTSGQNAHVKTLTSRRSRQDAHVWRIAPRHHGNRLRIRCSRSLHQHAVRV